MQALREFMLLTSVVLTLFGVASSRDVRVYRSAKPSKEVLSRIDKTRKSLGGKAHVLPTTVSRTGSHLIITVNLKGLTTGINGTVLSDEVYLDVPADGSSNSAQQSSNELWIKDQQTKAVLARVFLNSSRNGYRAIKMRNICAKWLENNKQTASLELRLASPQSGLSKHLLKKKSFFVIYTFSGTPPTSPKCESYDVTIKPQSLVNAAEFQTKICTPPDDVTFPFNGSSYFDVGAALRTSLVDNPIPRNAAVLRNPKCCMATEATSRRFARFDMKLFSIQVFELHNVEITECGCLIG